MILLYWNNLLTKSKTLLTGVTAPTIGSVMGVTTRKQDENATNHTPNTTSSVGDGLKNTPGSDMTAIVTLDVTSYVTDIMSFGTNGGMVYSSNGTMINASTTTITAEQTATIENVTSSMDIITTTMTTIKAVVANSSHSPSVTGIIDGNITSNMNFGITSPVTTTLSHVLDGGMTSSNNVMTTHREITTTSGNRMPSSSNAMKSVPYNGMSASNSTTTSSGVEMGFSETSVGSDKILSAINVTTASGMETVNVSGIPPIISRVTSAVTTNMLTSGRGTTDNMGTDGEGLVVSTSGEELPAFNTVQGKLVCLFTFT